MTICLFDRTESICNLMINVRHVNFACLCHFHPLPLSNLYFVIFSHVCFLSLSILSNCHPKPKFIIFCVLAWLTVKTRTVVLFYKIYREIRLNVRGNEGATTSNDARKSRFGGSILRKSGTKLPALDLPRRRITQ